MWWVWAAQSWLPTIAVAVMTVLAFFAALAQAPRMAKLYWLIALLVCGALAIAVAAWQQGRELAQLRELSSHLGALARLLPGGPPATPEQTVDSLATSMYSLNSRISELQAQIETLREKTKTRAIDSDTVTKLADYLRPFGSHRGGVSFVPVDVEAFTRFDIPFKSGTTSNDMIPDNTTVELFVSHKP